MFLNTGTMRFPQGQSQMDQTLFRDLKTRPSYALSPRVTLLQR
jgi:hypothetical protein